MPVAIAFRLVFGTAWGVLWHCVGPFKTLSGGLLCSFVCLRVFGVRVNELTNVTSNVNGWLACPRWRDMAE